MNSLTAGTFLESKGTASYLEYYKGHYLEHVALNLYTRFRAAASIEIMKASKQIKDPRTRRKALNLFHHSQSTSKPISMSDFHVLCKNGHLSLHAFKEYSKLDTSHRERFISDLKNLLFYDVDLSGAIGSHRKLVTVTEKLQRGTDLDKDRIAYEDTLEKVFTILGLNAKIIDTPTEIKKAACIYQACWVARTHQFHSGEMVLIELTNNDGQEIAVIRLHSDRNDINNLKSIAGWINPQICRITEETRGYYQMSEDDLETALREIHKNTGNEKYSPNKATTRELHYGDSCPVITSIVELLDRDEVKKYFEKENQQTRKLTAWLRS